MTVVFRHAYLLLAVAALTLMDSSAGAQGAAKPSAQGKGKFNYDEVVAPVVDLVTSEGTGEALSVMEQSVQHAKWLEDSLRGGVEQALKGKSSAVRKQGKKLIEGSVETSVEHAKEISWLRKFQKFAQMVDLVSTGAKATAYLVEGDTGGAAHVLLDDVCKKVCAAGGAAALSLIPGVGSIAGAALGEEGYKKYLKPLLDKRDQEERVRAAKAAQLKPWLRKEIGIDSRGEARERDLDMYYDQATGLIKRRSPAAQARWEELKKREFFDGRKLAPIREAYLAGKLPKSEYHRACTDFKSRDPLKVWEPPELDYTGAAPGNAGKPGVNILDRVKAKRVTAVGGDGDGAVTLTFWNVGSLAPGHGQATAVTVHVNGTETVHGTFSGGPNGTLSFVSDGEQTTLRLVGGSSISSNVGSFRVKNPEAFANWPTDL